MVRRKTLARFMDWIYVKAKLIKRCITTSLAAKRKLKSMNGGYNGSKKEFKDVVVKYWSKYGVRPKKYWYDLYCNGMDSYNPRFIPDTIWFGKIIPYYNNILFMRAYTDKNILDILYPSVKQPESVIKNIAGIYYNQNWEIITKNQAIEICFNEQELIFKTAIDSGAGRLINFYNKKTDSIETIENYFDDYKTGFIVQRLVKQHKDLAKIHSKSLNTLRIISFYFKGEVKVLSAQLRMGSGDARIDNYSAGGFACNVYPDGRLDSVAVSKFGDNLEIHPSGIAFKDIIVPEYDKVLSKVKELHKITPYYNLIGWDFAIDEDGEPVLIEFNVTQEQNQLGSRVPTFLDLTEEVLEDVFIQQSLKNLKN